MLLNITNVDKYIYVNNNIYSLCMLYLHCIYKVKIESTILSKLKPNFSAIVENHK
jgi:hypothetical protein